MFDAALSSNGVFAPLSWDGGKYIFSISCGFFVKHENAVGTEGDSWHIPPARCHWH